MTNSTECHLCHTFLRSGNSGAAKCDRRKLSVCKRWRCEHRLPYRSVAEFFFFFNLWHKNRGNKSRKTAGRSGDPPHPGIPSNRSGNSLLQWLERCVCTQVSERAVCTTDSRSSRIMPWLEKDNLVFQMDKSRRGILWNPPQLSLYPETLY